MDEEGSSVRVAVRIRPQLSRKPNQTNQTKPNQTMINNFKNNT